MKPIIRRDPRALWIARNRLHPLHQRVQSQSKSWQGPNGLLRKNPHAVGFVGPNGLKRIDRSGQQHAANAQASFSHEPVSLPLHRVLNPEFYIGVVPDMPGGRLSSHDKDLLGLARSLVGTAGAVLAVVFGEHKESTFELNGVDRLLHLNTPEFAGYSPEARVQVLVQLQGQIKPRHWLLADSRSGGAELGRRLAAALGERPATRVWQLHDGHVRSRAGAGQQDLLQAAPRIILASAECALPVSDWRYEVLPFDWAHAEPAPAPRVLDLGAVAVDPAQTPMAEAEFILAGGNGVSDWGLFHQAAEALGATEGASRVAVDNGFMPRNRQVGATGSWVTARVYLAVGISGAIQHLQGIGACDKVIAVNVDAGCDMVKRADFSVIGDSAEILQALLEQLTAYRQKGARHAA